MDISLVIESIAKNFGRNRLFRDISVSLSAGDSLAITGSNGSGKSTLLEITAGIRRPDRGSVSLVLDGRSIPSDRFLRHGAFISPRTVPYDELTGIENIRFSLRSPLPPRTIDEILERVSLLPHAAKRVRYYSTGMRQRLKIAMALLNDPPVLYLDEPGSNLDNEGKSILYSLVEERRNNRIILIATNEPAERALCGKEIHLGS
jgi:heme exporter protein A